MTRPDPILLTPQETPWATQAVYPAHTVRLDGSTCKQKIKGDEAWPALIGSCLNLTHQTNGNKWSLKQQSWE